MKKGICPALNISTESMQLHNMQWKRHCQCLDIMRVFPPQCKVWDILASSELAEILANFPVGNTIHLLRWADVQVLCRKERKLPLPAVLLMQLCMRVNHGPRPVSVWFHAHRSRNVREYREVATLRVSLIDNQLTSGNTNWLKQSRT